MEIRGDEGTMFINNIGYTIYDLQGKVVRQNQGSRGDDEHIANFLDAVRDGTATNANIEEGHISAMYCHLGNMAYRTNQILEVEAETGRIKNNKEASQYWGREYRTGWSPQELG